MNNDKNYLPFSQRNGFEPIPPQLELGMVSDKQRLLFFHAVNSAIDRDRKSGSLVIGPRWNSMAKDVYVRIFGMSVSGFSARVTEVKALFDSAISEFNIAELYDLLEYIIRHDMCDEILKSDVAAAFVETRAAYRIADDIIIAIGTEEQGDAVESALQATDEVGATASRRHLISAGVELREGNWPDSVRESIHAVEAMARRISPDARTLGDALNKIERSGYIHGSLRRGFGMLYGYTSDENGIRHALSDEATRVDEVDALFMLGACASFVSYLIAREKSLLRSQ